MRTPPECGACDLKAALEAVGYEEETVLKLLGLPHPWNYLPAWRPLLLARLEESPGPLADAVAALFLDEPVENPQGDWVGPARAAGLLEGGFIVWPYRGLRLVSDPPGPRGMQLHGPRLPMRDRVFPVDASTDLLLQSLVPVAPGTRTLDLGCGTGVLSLLHEGSVGTDINPRCLAFAEFNRQLNGRPPVDWRQGDLLAPATGERFDRVLSNLPFVPTPEGGDGHAWYWDGGHRGQALSARLLQGLPEVLTPGGMAQFTCGLVNPSSEDALSVLAAWLGDPTMSLLALYGAPQDMARSIPLLATSEADPHEADYPAVVRRWWSAARTSDVREVAPAVVTVVNDGGGMRAAFPMVPGRHDFGPAIQRMVRGWRHLQSRSADWEAWRTVRLVPVPGLHLVQEQIWEGEDWVDTPCRVGFTDRPWRLQQTLGRDSVRVLRRCDGLRPLEDVVFAFCMESGRDPATVRTRLLEALPTWISSGILEVAE